MFSQDKGTIKGKVTDKEMGGEALPFANVFIKGTSIGATTDIDGNYTINAPVGNQTIVFSFVGYQTVEKPVVVKAGQTTVINQEVGANEGVALDEIEIKGTVSKEKETALLLEQKKAVVIKESIGAQELSKKGVSDAATATTKISGVTKSEGTGDIYIRGLGDRYLSTSMNGLPIPSDDVEKKNINLNLFPTSILQNVGISKTFSSSRYADEASGNVDIVSKEYSKDLFKISVSGGVNSNILGLDGDFRRTIISDDVTFGFHEKKRALVNQITMQGWGTKIANNNLNFGASLSAAKKFDVFGKQLSIFTTASHSRSFNYRDEIFRAYRSNILNKGFAAHLRGVNKERGVTSATRDVERFTLNNNTTGYVNVKLKLNDNNSIKYNTLFVNKGKEELFEAGRKGFGYVFDQDPQEDGAFIRDQNYKQTTMFVNQLMGKHKWNANNTLNWAGGYNFVLAEEPNRIRNEVNILDITKAPTVQYAHVGDYQQRKSSQKIEDTEYNAFINNAWKLGYTTDEYEDKPYTLNYGFNYRKKERSFKSQFVGVFAKGEKFRANSIDDLTDTFTNNGFNNGLELKVAEPDRFIADLQIIAAYVNFDFDFNNNISGNLGLRYEWDEMTALWDVTNYIDRETGTPRIGQLTKSYSSLYPSVNLKYEINEKHFLRFASSVTQTLPEFKEISPFEYVSPTGRVTKGNPELEKSDVYNFDLKWEFFPNRSELISATAFYKQIENPINAGITRGSSGYFQFANTGEKADVFGIEIEGRLDLLKNDDDQSLLSTTANVTKMWTNQDLLPNFQYFNKKESNLQGASDLILNASVTYNNHAERPFIATLTGNYSSDKIFVLGGQEDFAKRETLYNSEIIENGFFTLDLVLSKEITEGFNAKLIGKNLLNPDIKQTQMIRNNIIDLHYEDTVRLYNNGTQIGLNLSYQF